MNVERTKKRRPNTISTAVPAMHPRAMLVPVPMVDSSSGFGAEGSPAASSVDSGSTTRFSGDSSGWGLSWEFSDTEALSHIIQTGSRAIPAAQVYAIDRFNLYFPVTDSTSVSPSRETSVSWRSLRSSHSFTAFSNPPESIPVN